jgi:damage-control phosphatase, subfamily I
MKTYFDCIPCFIRQALNSARLVTDDEIVHEQVLRSVLQATSEMDLRDSPPAMGQYIHRMIRKTTGNSDPYREIKDRFNQLALELYPTLKARIESSANPLETALKLAIAGNVIDFGVNNKLEESTVYESVENALMSTIDGDFERFSDAVSRADNILYLADNAGEIVFDRLLIERLPLERITLAVRGFPVINDATMDDARAAGITGLVEVMDNGADVPGTILQECNEAFIKRFREAELIIAKGQGNYETLSEAEKDIFFILKAKCPVIARDLGCQVGSLVLKNSACAMISEEKGGGFARI